MKWQNQTFNRYLLQYQEPIPCEQLVSSLCDIKQVYTQLGGTALCIIECLLTTKAKGWQYSHRKATVWCFATLHGLG